MSYSESRPRKVELMHMHSIKCDYCEYFTHNHGACIKLLQNNLTTLIYSLVTGLYNIIIELIKLVFDVEQLGISRDLMIPTQGCTRSISLSSVHPC